MPTNSNTVTVFEVIRETSAKGKVFNALKDGKVHSLKTIRALVKKHGNAGTGIGAVYGLGRILTAYQYSKRVVINREKDTVQLVPVAQIAKQAKPVAQTK